MASDLCIIPTLHDIEKSVLDLSSQVRLQSAFLRDLIERVGEEEEGHRGMDEVNGKIVLNENEAEKILERTSDLKEELEKFKLNLKNYQDFMKQSRNGGKIWKRVYQISVYYCASYDKAARVISSKSKILPVTKWYPLVVITQVRLKTWQHLVLLFQTLFYSFKKNIFLCVMCLWNNCLFPSTFISPSKQFLITHKIQTKSGQQAIQTV